jgi:hypothetical protein
VSVQEVGAKRVDDSAPGGCSKARHRAQREG